METNDFSLGIGVLLALNLQVNHVAWHAERHKDYKIIDTNQTLTLCGNVCYGNILQYRIWFLFS
jgi:hypothetical protein